MSSNMESSFSSTDNEQMSDRRDNQSRDQSPLDGPADNQATEEASSEATPSITIPVDQSNASEEDAGRNTTQLAADQLNDTRDDGSNEQDHATEQQENNGAIENDAVEEDAVDKNKGNDKKDDGNGSDAGKKRKRNEASGTSDSQAKKKEGMFTLLVYPAHMLAQN